MNSSEVIKGMRWRVAIANARATTAAVALLPETDEIALPRHGEAMRTKSAIIAAVAEAGTP